LFFDFDDTVFVDRQIPRENREALQAAQAAGHKIILNTGRSWGGLLQEPEGLTVAWDGFILGAGDIRFDGKILRQDRLPENTLFAWLEYCMDRHFVLGYGGEKKFVRLSFREYEGEVGEETRAEARALLRREIDENGNLPTKISIYEKSDLFDRNALPSDPADMIFHPSFVEVYAPGCNKGSAILKFCEAIGATVDQCVCFGDSNNDVDMFDVCPTSVCMSCAPKHLKEKATLCAESKYGVAEGIWWLLDEKSVLTNA
jgi:hydroxymethylpyrimidine pyrophosphatase-like HAD family hydrolase